MTREEAFPIVRECVALSLALEPAQIAPGSRLVADLGADSLDFLDIIFMLEKRLGVKLREDELGFLSRVDASSPRTARGGLLAADAVERLKVWVPALKDAPDPARVTAGQVFSLVTVETLCILVERKMGGGTPA